MKSNNKKRINYITTVGILSALAAVLMILDFPVWFAPSFYKFDFGDLPALIGAFLLGPAAGIIIELIKVLLNLLLNGTVTAYVGEISNFIMSLALILPAGLIYKHKKTKKTAIISLICGVCTITVVSTAVNYFLLIPAYSAAMGIPLDVIIGAGTKLNPAITDMKTFILFAVVPFNLFKSGICSIVTFIVYKKAGAVLGKIIK